MATRVLIIRFSSIGDIVLTTPVIRMVKEQLDGEVEVHYLTKKSFEPLLKANPYIHTLHTIEDKVSEVLSTLQELQFDYIIDLHKNIRTMQVKKGLQTLALSFDKINWPKWLIVNLKIDRLPDVHIVDRYLDATKAFGVENDGRGLDYFIPAEEEVDLSVLPEGHRNGYIAFAIGGNHNTKVMPEDKIIDICKKLEVPVVLLGGKEDAARGHKISSYVGPIIYNACGQFSINQSASLVRQAQTVISHDTGLMHIAAAFKKDIVSVWGNTIPEFGMYPYLPKGEGSSTIIEVKNLRCRPCSKLGFDKCPKKHFHCMNRIDADEVAAAAKKNLLL